MGLLFYATCSLLSVSLSFTFLKLFLYTCTQSIVCILYLHVAHIIFTPSVPSPQSVVHNPQPSFYSDTFERQFSHSVGKN